MVCVLSNVLHSRLLIFKGDSGGPLLIPSMPSGNISAGKPEKDLLIGIVSASPENCNDDAPSLFMSMGYFWTWVQQITEGRSVRRHLLFLFYAAFSECRTPQSRLL